MWTHIHTLDVKKTVWITGFSCLEQLLKLASLLSIQMSLPHTIISQTLSTRNSIKFMLYLESERSLIKSHCELNLNQAKRMFIRTKMKMEPLYLLIILQCCRIKAREDKSPCITERRSIL